MTVRAEPPQDPPPIFHPPSGENCLTCKYGITRIYQTVNVLECRYTDPEVQGSKAVWGQVEDDDWCGRWAAK